MNKNHNQQVFSKDAEKLEQRSKIVMDSLKNIHSIICIFLQKSQILNQNHKSIDEAFAESMPKFFTNVHQIDKYTDAYMQSILPTYLDALLYHKALAETQMYAHLGENITADKSYSNDLVKQLNSLIAASNDTSQCVDDLNALLDRSKHDFELQLYLKALTFHFKVLRLLLDVRNGEQFLNYCTKSGPRDLLISLIISYSDLVTFMSDNLHHINFNVLHSNQAAEFIDAITNETKCFEFILSVGEATNTFSLKLNDQKRSRLNKMLRLDNDFKKLFSASQEVDYQLTKQQLIDDAGKINF